MDTKNGFRQLISLSFRNTSAKDKPLELKFRKPDILKNNLDSKLLKIRKFTVNNSYIPIFIPQRVKTTETSYFNITMSTSNTITFGNLTPDSLKYFIIVRRNSDNFANTRYILNVPEKPTLVKPNNVIDNDVEYYSNEYYWYHDIMHFLDIIANQINQGGLSFGVPPKCNITFGQNGFTFYFDKTFIDTFDVEFSESLIQLFPLRSFISPYVTNTNAYVLKMTDFELSSGTTTYRSSSCLLYEKGFPFDGLLINSDDLSLNSTMFLDERLLSSNVQDAIMDNTLLEYNIRSNQFNRIYDFYTYNSDNDSLYNNFYLNSSTASHINLKFYLRLKNGILIEYKLKSNEMMSLTMEIVADI